MIDSGKKFRTDLIKSIDGVPMPHERKDFDLDNPKKPYFDWCNFLGKGSFGIIVLGKIKSTQDYFAVKIFRKDVLLERNMIEESCREIEVMQKFNH